MKYDPKITAMKTGIAFVVLTAINVVMSLSVSGDFPLLQSEVGAVVASLLVGLRNWLKNK